MGFEIDMMMSSPQLRALQSTNYVKKGYGNKDMQIHLMVQIYEEAGVYVYQDDSTQPGLTKSQVMEVTPEIVINEDQSKLIDETGWFKID